MADKIKALIVDDSAFMRLLISDLVDSDPHIEVVGTANDGHQAYLQVCELSPDIVILDLNMADFDGLYAIKTIMKEKPTPILILSSVGNTDLQPVFEGLKFGAVDYMNKPNRNKSKVREIELELVSKIKSVTRAKPKVSLPQRERARPVSKSTRKLNYDIIAVGASTGGPTALEQFISSLPPSLNVPVLICQHMPNSFIPPFVNRLNAITELEVLIATKGMPIRPGQIIFCPGHANLILADEFMSGQGIVDFTSEKYPEYNNPSINAMMQSVAEIYKEKSIGIVLTGMGKDGLNGIKAIKSKGGYTIAQDKQSSVIYGMPKVAAESGKVDVSLDIKEIGPYITRNL